MKKTCTKCKDEKPADAFPKKQGMCKVCYNVYMNNYQKTYMKNNQRPEKGLSEKYLCF